MSSSAQDRASHPEIGSSSAHASSFSSPPDSSTSFWMRYRLGPEVGKGVQGSVFEGTRLSDGLRVAIKRVPRRNFSAQADEIAIMREINHENVIRLFDVIEDVEFVYIVMEFAAGGDVCDYIVRTRTPFSEQAAARMMTDILLGLSHLHLRSIVHLDVKPDNILFLSPDEGSPLKLADFGWARVLREGSHLNRLAGTLSYAAPEVVAQYPYGKSADMYSIGITLFVILSGRVAYGTNDGGKIRRSLLLMHRDGSADNFPSFSSSVWRGISEDAKDFIRRCLSIDPNLRPTVDEALQHPWIVNANNLPSISLDETLTEMSKFNRRRKLKFLHCPVSIPIMYAVRNHLDESPLTSLSRSLFFLNHTSEQSPPDPVLMQDVLRGRGIQRIFSVLVSSDTSMRIDAASVLMNIASDETLAREIVENGGFRYLLGAIDAQNPVLARFALITLFNICTQNNVEFATRLVLVEKCVSKLVRLPRGENSEGISLLAAELIAHLSILSFDIRDFIVSDSGSSMLMYLYLDSSDESPRRLALLSLAKIAEHEVHFNRLWKDEILPRLKSLDLESSKDMFRLLADLSTWDDSVGRNFVSVGLIDHLYHWLESISDFGPPYVESFIYILNLIGNIASHHEVRQRMDDLDITSRLRSMEVNMSTLPAEDSIDLKFMFEWVLSVLSDDPSVGPVLDESFQRSALLHQLPGSLRFRSDAHSPQTIMFRYLVKNKKFYFEVILENSVHLRLGIMTPHSDSATGNTEVGDDSSSFAFEAERSRSIHGGRRKYVGRKCSPGEVIGCAVDLVDGAMYILKKSDPRLSELFAPRSISTASWYSAVVSFGRGQQASVNFGQDPFILEIPESFVSLQDAAIQELEGQES